MSQIEIDRLNDRIEELEELLGVGGDDVGLIKSLTRMPPTACKIVSLLRRRRGIVTKGSIFTALYGGRVECDQPVYKIIDVQLHRARRGLHELGVEIHTVSHVGLMMPEDSRRKLTSLMEQVLPQAVEPVEAAAA